MRTILRDNYTPEIGDYHEIIVRDEANDKVWLFDCDGIYSDITAGDTGPRRSSVVDVVSEPSDLETYDKSSLVVGDTIIVMEDPAGIGLYKTSIYRLNELKQFEKIDNINAQDGPAFCAENGISFSAGTSGDPCSFMLRGVAMTGATTIADGAMGMVPAPLIADREKYLRGDGTWQEVAAPIALVNGYQDAPTTPGSAISANGIGFEIFGRKPGSGTATLIDFSKVRMHKNANISHPNVGGWSYVVLGEAAVDSTNCGSVAIGCGDIDEGGAWVEGDSAIAIGAGAWVVGDSTIAIGHNAYAVDNNNPALYGNIAIGNNVEAKRSGSMAIGSSAVASSGDAIAFGNSATASGSAAIAIGQNATASAAGSIAFPYSSSTTQGVMDLGVFNTSFGYNNTNYRLISNVHDPVNAQDAATKGYVDARILLNAGAPSTSTVGAVGQLLSDTTNGALYQCTAVDTTDPNNPVYTWDLVGGGTPINVVQTTGNSQTDVMSQDATTKMIWQDIAASQKVIKIGNTAVDNYAFNSLSIGGQYLRAGDSIVIGIGSAVTTGSSGSVVVGRQATSGSMNNMYGAIALGFGSGTNITGPGMMDISTTNTYYGYNSNSNYRLLTGLYDAQNAHDAVTLGQLSSLITLINTLLNTNIVINNGVISDGNSNQNSPAPTYPYTSGTRTYYLYNNVEVYVNQMDASQNLYYSSDDTVAIPGGEWGDNGDGTVSYIGSGSGEEPSPEEPVSPDDPVAPDEPAPEDSGEAAPEG